ncbi:replication factor A protein 3 [Laetiporus sulphureus 93-53]|uniref:Replication factor A protein 3 n=1 Tax=Laetiporus sulphureus 93-53 TaxID=1314785 RepID=A0A165DBT5_9APHY|nr:replication factor A protein 3 [Laetiporus sulphureus 93-53]KZT04510.1 replication factor A protein 3 [Laetiporus sulphureus 93-53]
MSENISPRVNAARMQSYIGRIVRLMGRVVRAGPEIPGQEPTAILEASDKGEVVVILNSMSDSPSTTINSAYVEIVGSVQDERTIKMMTCINLGNELDMDLVNDVVELWHDPRFVKMVGFA